MTTKPRRSLGDWAAGPAAPPVVAIGFAVFLAVVVALYAVYALHTGHV